MSSSDSSSCMSVTVRVPAKINLLLQSGALMSDGYHPLITIFQAVSLYDVVTARYSEEIYINSLSGKYVGSAPVDSSNLAVRAAKLLASYAGIVGGVALDIVKHIPVGGGMGGGSADAAATLVACNKLWGTNLDMAELSLLGRQLGSDVPFALCGGTALGLGRGEELSSIAYDAKFRWIVAHLRVELSTREVFCRFDQLDGGVLSVEGRDLESGGLFGYKYGRQDDLGRVVDIKEALLLGDSSRLGEIVCNDLTLAAIDLYPDIGVVMKVGEDCGVLASLLSGSGSTVLFLVEQEYDDFCLREKLFSLPAVRDIYEVFSVVGGVEVV